jgi:hypothetical protein
MWEYVFGNAEKVIGRVFYSEFKVQTRASVSKLKQWGGVFT